MACVLSVWPNHGQILARRELARFTATIFTIKQLRRSSQEPRGAGDGSHNRDTPTLLLV